MLPLYLHIEGPVIRRIMVTKMMLIIKVALLITCAPWCTLAQPPPTSRLVVPMTLVPKPLADTLGAFCLDGSLPAYHIHKGFGPGERNWLLQFEGGGWCNNVKTCLERAKTFRGSTRLMTQFEIFSGILSNDSSLNPDFYNWNRVKIRYCDGASFAGNSQFDDGKSVLYFRGQKIWQAVIQDLLPKGLANADKALLSGCSAGGLATFLHCDNFTNTLPRTASVKCLSDAGFFLDIADISQNFKARAFYNDLITLQGVNLNFDTNCATSVTPPQQCFFPQHLLPYIKTPYFILNSAYDVFQFHHHFIPPSVDREGHWTPCSTNLTSCSPSDINVLQGLRNEMVKALDIFNKNSLSGGIYINSCFAHCQSESQDTWLAPDSPKVHNMTISEAVGNWYFGRSMTKLIDDPYPSNPTCHNLI